MTIRTSPELQRLGNSAFAQRQFAQAIDQYTKALEIIELNGNTHIWNITTAMRGSLSLSLSLCISLSLPISDMKNVTVFFCSNHVLATNDLVLFMTTIVMILGAIAQPCGL